MTLSTMTIMLTSLVAILGPADPPPILIADFESADYGDWTVTGTAFGDGPARGTLPDQMDVSGYLGDGLVNSYRGGDDAMGTLTSPTFRIERPYLNMLIGGGDYPEQTCVQLIVENEVVREATGTNTRPGGSERLDWVTWDIDDLRGQNARIRIVDERRGGWGHINVDHIVQSSTKRQAGPQSVTRLADSQYLNLPVDRDAPVRRMTITANGALWSEFEIRLALDEPDFWVFRDVSRLRDQPLVIAAERLPADSNALEAIHVDDVILGAPMYDEPRRPQFHFTSRRGWHNDPNGLVYFDGEYHLYYQRNPYGWDWGNMHWGHAVSPDLIHWTELPVAIPPREFGDWAFSGSAIIDDGRGAFGSSERPALIAALTSTGRGEIISVSRDRGRTFEEFEGNPVVTHRGRDPKIIWHEPTKKWVMVVYDEHDDERWIAFYVSDDLRAWELTDRVLDFYECPDLFELPVEGRPGVTLWVLSAADGRYLLGDFDGREYTTRSGKHQLWYGNYYAAQTFDNTPDGRRIQIGWGRGITFPEMPFNQQMTIPHTLTLRPTAEGVRLFAEPVTELETLRTAEVALPDVEVDPDKPLTWVGSGAGDLLDMEATIVLEEAEMVALRIFTISLVYDAISKKLKCGDVEAPLDPVDGRVRLRILVDRGSIEVFANDGRIALSVAARPDTDAETVVVSTQGGTAKVVDGRLSPLKSAWTRTED